MENVFDPLKFFDELKAADVPEKQARAQAEALHNAFSAYDASRRLELATKGDLREVELRLENKIESMRHELLKWLIGLLLAQSGFLVAVFAWLR